MKTLAVSNLGGGINSYNGTESIGNSEMQVSSRNIRGKAEGFTVRNGYITFADLLTGSTAGIRAFGAYIRNDATLDVLTAVYNNKLYKINPLTGSAWTEIATALITSGTNVNMSNYRDWLFIFNGVDKPIRVENTTVTQPFVAPASLVAATFLPSFGEIYGSSLFCSGVPTAPNTVYISKASTSANPEYVYDFSGALTSFGDANELLFQSRVTGIRTLSTAAVIFTVDSTFYVPGLKEFGTTVTFDVQPVGGASGAVSHKTTCVVENDVFYLTPQKEIKSVRRSQGNQQSFTTTSLSTKIQDFLNTYMDDDMSTAFTVYDPINKHFKLYFKQTGGVMNTLCLVADLNKVDQYGVPAWYLDDSKPFGAGIFYKGQLYTGSTVLGRVYKDEYGLADDDSASIIATRTGKEMDFGNAASLKNFRRVRVAGTITQATTVTANVYVDNTLVVSRVINTDDLAVNPPLGGIGTATIGTFPIAMESEPNLSTVNQYNFVQVLSLRKRGKSLRVDFVTDGTNNKPYINYYEISALPVNDLLNSISEK